jgi:hypothetical protein
VCRAAECVWVSGCVEYGGAGGGGVEEVGVGDGVDAGSGDLGSGCHR